MTDTSPRGWTHAEAKQHTLVERLLERCATYAGGRHCAQRPDLPHEDWCERCLAAEALTPPRPASDTTPAPNP